MKFHSLRLAVEHLDLDRGGRPLVRGLSFALTSGEALIVTGPNGSGKTTLLRTIAGLLRPSAGRIRFEGEGASPASVASGTHYVGHANGLKASLTAQENVAFWATMLDIGAPGALPAAAALAKLGLAPLADLPIAYLSAGQKRRAALARLLAARRPLWLLDEPTTALDAASQARMEELIQDHLAQGGLAVVATHAPLARVAGRELRLGVA